MEGEIPRDLAPRGRDHGGGAKSLGHRDQSRLAGSRQTDLARVFSFWSFVPMETVYKTFSIPGCHFIPVLGAEMKLSWDELIPPQNRVNNGREITKYRD